MTTLDKKSNNLSNQELFKYALGSLQLINDYLKDYDEKSFSNNIMIQDAACYRIKEVGNAIIDISDDIKDKHYNFDFYLYNSLSFGLCPTEIWHLYTNKSKEDFDSLNSLFYHLEQIYFKEYIPKKIERITQPKQNFSWSTDYKYPIKTKNSLWTVQKK